MSLTIPWGCLNREITMSKTSWSKILPKSLSKFLSSAFSSKSFHLFLDQGKWGNPREYVLGVLHSHCVLGTSHLNDLCAMPGSHVDEGKNSWAKFCHCTQEKPVVSSLHWSLHSRYTFLICDSFWKAGGWGASAVLLLLSSYLLQDK